MSEVFAPQRSSISGNRAALSWSVLFIASTSLLFSLCAIFVGFHHSIFDFHGFRQAQTAISAEYMEHGGAFFHYQTPVFGPPWSIPFEFPLYQKIVALIAEHFHTPLDETGRTISIAFFYLSFLPLSSILKRLGYRPIQVLAVLSVVAVSPLYIFVSRMFMIESTALFLSIMYVDQTFRLAIDEASWTYGHMVLAGVLGTLAGLVKVTTFAPYLLLGCGLIAWYGRRFYKKRTLSVASWTAAAFFCLLLPVLCTALWTRFADAQKSKNPIGIAFTSKSLASFNFGTLADRLNPSNYVHLLHAFAGQIGYLPALCLLVLVYGVLVRKWNYSALVAAALYVITPMIFFHLHVLHEYYAYSSAIFLIVAAGLLIADMLALPDNRAWIGLLFLIILIASCIVRYRSNFYPLQQNNAPGRPEAAAMIDHTTSPSDIIVVTGLDWSSELPYQSHRRAIMDSGGVAAHFPGSLGPIAAVIQMQHADAIPEIVVCGDSRGSNRAEALLALLEIQPSSPLHADDCDIYLRSAH